MARNSSRSLRARTLAAIHACAARHGIDAARLYELASAVTGRLLQPGFGLSTCTDQELGAVVEAVKRAAGLPAGARGQGPGASFPRSPTPDPRPPRREAPNVIRLASLAQLSFLRTLTEELRWGPGECAGHFTRACGSAHPRTSGQVSQCIEACKDVKRRRYRTGGGASDRTDQSDPSDRSDRTGAAGIEKSSQ